MRKQSLIYLAIAAMPAAKELFVLLTHVIDLLSKVVNYAGQVRELQLFVPEWKKKAGLRPV